MTYYVGLDVSLRTVNICVINDRGQIKAETKLDSEVTEIIAYLDGLELEITSVGLEAGTLCQYLTYKAGVDDPYRFKHSRTVAAHFGLTPRRFQSGEIDIDGHISRCGDRDVRCTPYTAANALLTRSSKWSPLKAWGMKLAKTRGHRRAVIAVARKLGSPHRPTNACSDWIVTSTDCEEKRDPRQDATISMP